MTRRVRWSSEVLGERYLTINKIISLTSLILKMLTLSVSMREKIVINTKACLKTISTFTVDCVQRIISWPGTLFKQAHNRCFSFTSFRGPEKLACRILCVICTLEKKEGKSILEQRFPFF